MGVPRQRRLKVTVLRNCRNLDWSPGSMACVLVFDDYTWEFPTILLLCTVLNLRKEGYTVQHPNPLFASEKEFPEARADISSCPWEFSRPPREELHRLTSGAVRRVGWRPSCCFSKQKGSQKHPACSVLCHSQLLQLALAPSFAKLWKHLLVLEQWFHVAIPERLASK